jgi:hypothetical protein
MKRSFVFVLMLLFSASGQCEAIRDFFISCGYGTLAGAAVGAMSVAVSENPSEKSMNIARGASLGLYAGIGYGIYRAQHSASEDREVRIWIQPLLKEKHFHGAEIKWLAASF